MATDSLQFDEPVSVDLTLPKAPAVALASELVRLAIQAHRGPDGRELPEWLLSHPALSQDVLAALIEQDPHLLTELGHQQGPPELLQILAEQYDYPEAVLTLAKRYFTSPEIAVETLSSFLQRHSNDEWLLRSLAHLPASSPEKDQVFRDTIGSREDLLNYLIDARRSQDRAREAASAAGEDSIQRLYDTGDPAALRMLAANQNTPDRLLLEMIEAKGMNSAREIRRLARLTYARKQR